MSAARGVSGRALMAVQFICDDAAIEGYAANQASAATTSVSTPVSSVG
jgi:hypothetical protein